GLDDRGDVGGVGGLTGARRVEVDAVDPRRALGLEPQRHLDRVVAVDDPRVEVALHQLHDLATEQVDGGEQVHQAATASRARATKLASMAMPVSPDFSGWNWVAMTVRRSTAATTSPP